jgi:hypothetical protein
LNDEVKLNADGSNLAEEYPISNKESPSLNCLSEIRTCHLEVGDSLLDIGYLNPLRDGILQTLKTVRGGSGRSGRVVSFVRRCRLVETPTPLAGR